MYLNEKRIKAIKIKNLLFAAIAIFFLVESVSWELYLTVRYWGDTYTIMHAAATPGFFFWIIVGPLMLTDAIISASNLDDARFYSGYFECNSDGYVRIADLAEAIGKREAGVKRQLELFLQLYMYNYLVREDAVELAYKFAGGQYVNSGAITSEYRISPEFKAGVMAEEEFQSSPNKTKTVPVYYTPDHLEDLRALYSFLTVISVIVIVVMIHGIIQAILNFDNKEYYRAIILDVSKHMQSRELIRYHLIETIIINSFVVFVVLTVFLYIVKRMNYAGIADVCAKHFSQCNTAMVKISELPSYHSAGDKRKVKLVREAIRKGYLKHCTIKKYYGDMAVFLLRNSLERQDERQAVVQTKPYNKAGAKKTEKVRNTPSGVQLNTQSDTPSNDKAEIMCVIMVFVFSIICFLASIWQYGLYTDLRDNCTAEIIGVVDQVNKGRVSSTDPVETRYLSNSKKQTKLHIQIEPDGVFKRKRIYANPSNSEEVGSEVVIHYSPDDPDLYYINDHAIYYRDAAIFVFGIGIASLIGSFFLGGYVKKEIQKEKSQKKNSLQKSQKKNRKGKSNRK